LPIADCRLPIADLLRWPVASYPEFQPKDRAHWRRWLQTHHASSKGVTLIYVKKPVRSLPYADAVEEALCFGWIDSVLRPMDEIRYGQLFTPRKPKSGWSALNKRRVEAMIADGLMTNAGLAKIEAAKQDGSWTRLDHIEQLTIPPDLEKALKRNAKARSRFDSLTPSQRKIFLYYLHGVKREDLRAQWLKESVERLAAGARHPREPIRTAAPSSGRASTRGTPARTRRRARRT
jgi:uncharacterized protein YdeI (YjbR/CyaY-like superfamily)